MPLSTLQQIEVDTSASYDDTLDPANAESSAVTIQDDFNYIRSQVLDLLGSDNSNWYDTPTITLTSLKARATLEAKLMIRRIQVLTDITVPASQNYVVLSVSGSEAPTRNIAIGASTEGCISAQLAGAVGSHDLAEVAGANALNPKNLVRVQDGDTGEAILSGGKEIHALIQVESTASDGVAFDDSANQGQLSFVRVNATNDDLEAVPFADIQGKDINYLYADRINMDDALEQDFDPGGVFTDQAGTVDVTLQNAITNQTGAVTQGAKSIDIQITDTYEWQFSDSAGAAILTIFALSAGDRVDVGDGTTEADLRVHGGGTFDKSLIADNDGQAINIGVTTGRIDSTSLELESTTGNLDLDSAAELRFADSRQTTPLPLSDAVNTALTGSPASLFEAINEAAAGSGIDREDANTTGAVPANTLITSASNLSASLVDYWDTDAATTRVNFTDNVIIFINGRYMRPGADAAANNDVYPSVVQAEAQVGAFYAEFAVKNNANIMMLKVA